MFCIFLLEANNIINFSSNVPLAFLILMNYCMHNALKLNVANWQRTFSHLSNLYLSCHVMRENQWNSCIEWATWELSDWLRPLTFQWLIYRHDSCREMRNCDDFHCPTFLNIYALFWRWRTNPMRCLELDEKINK